MDFTAERTGQKIVLAMPNAEDIGLFLAQIGMRIHPDLAVLRRTPDADGETTWVPVDAPDIPQREFPVPTDEVLAKLGGDGLDALEAAIKRARERAKEMGVDLNGVPDNAG